MLESLTLLLLCILAIALLIAPFTLLIGVFKILFQKEDKKFGIQLVTYSVIIIIIGIGTCSGMGNNPIL